MPGRKLLRPGILHKRNTRSAPGTRLRVVTSWPAGHSAAVQPPGASRLGNRLPLPPPAAPPPLVDRHPDRDPNRNPHADAHREIVHRYPDGRTDGNAQADPDSQIVAARLLARLIMLFLAH